MKKVLFSILLLSAAALVSCGSDNDEPTNPNNGESTELVNPSNVFVNGLPKSIDGMTISTNSKGQVTTIKKAGKTVTFEYGSGANQPATAKKIRSFAPTSSDVIMRIDEDDDHEVYYLTIGKNGFVSHAVEVDDDGEGDVLDFYYSPEGYLIKMIQDYEMDDITTIEWKNGDIARVLYVEGGYEKENWVGTISYTDANNNNAIENKGCVMLYDEMFGVDIDDLKYAYYAGMLGKATKHLPLSFEQFYPGYSDTVIDEFVWTLSSTGFPTSVRISKYDQISFGW